MYETEDANELDNDANYNVAADEEQNECFAEQDLDLDEWIDEYDINHSCF